MKPTKLRDEVDHAAAREAVPALLDEMERLRSDKEDYQNREAACCPEDVGFDEYIKAIEKKLERLRAENVKNPPGAGEEG